MTAAATLAQVEANCRREAEFAEDPVEAARWEFAATVVAGAAALVSCDEP